MSKDYFTKVNFDETFPPETVAEVQAAAPEVDVQQVAEIMAVIAVINKELQNIQAGTSILMPHAMKFVESKTPFCIALTQFPNNPSLVGALTLVALAKQDFNGRFAQFVLELFQTIYGSK